MSEEKKELQPEEAEEVAEETAETAEAVEEVAEDTVETEAVKDTEEEAAAEEEAPAAEAVETEEAPAAEEAPSEALTQAPIKKKRNTKGIVAVTAFVLVVVALFAMAFSNNSKMSDEEYLALLETSSYEIIDDSYVSYVIVSSRLAYFGENDDINLFYAENLVDLQEGLAETDEMMAQLAKPTSTYQEEYEHLSALYDSYMACYELVFEYGEDEAAYIEAATIALDDFVETYTAFYDVIVVTFGLE